ncbi:MAG: hypothetical protein KC729_19755, partial [Candidatus Eisenbacteria bacterium]|nr:hypothetical protein [Candidatus Eisenbacteria bacterium]
MSTVPEGRVYEKLGAFYLGRTLDPRTAEPGSDLLLYDSKDLTTHAVCVGMTGSGKTGLCMALLEEAAIDGIPAIAIDPKGDLGNLLLSFPELRGEDFAPWIDPAEAVRKGQSVDQFAATTANKWREGLASWGQGPDRIRKLRDSADFAIYTPGSQAGLPLSILGSFAAPSAEVRADGDLMRERITASVSGLLALAGIDADPIQSREHILLSNLLDRAWRDGRSLGLPDLIRQIQSPPFDRIGVLDLESIFPAKDRFQLAIGLNNLLGSPNFAAWMEGEPLDVGRLLYTGDGRGSRSSRSRTSTIASGCSSSRSCSTRWWRGCGRSRAPPVCARSCTWTRSSVSSLRCRTRPPRPRCSPCSSRRALSGWASFSPPRTRSISTTRACPTPARGSSGG